MPCEKVIKEEMLTFERANGLFKYGPETGLLIGKVTAGNNRFHAGTPVGCSSPDGYLRVRVDKVLHPVHRVCCLPACGSLPDDMQAGHVNHVRDDNRLCNIRIADNTINSRNASTGKDNTTGVCGVYADKRRVKKYCAEIKVNRVKEFPGYSDTSDEAAAARREAELKYGFHSNHGTDKAAYVKKR